MDTFGYFSPSTDNTQPVCADRMYEGGYIHYRDEPDAAPAASIQQTVGAVAVPPEIDLVPSRVSETVLRQGVVVGPIIPARTGAADIGGAEPLRKSALSNCQADFPDNIFYLHLLHPYMVWPAGKFPGTIPECQ